MKPMIRTLIATLVVFAGQIHYVHADGSCAAAQQQDEQSCRNTYNNCIIGKTGLTIVTVGIGNLVDYFYPYMVNCQAELDYCMEVAGQKAALCNRMQKMQQTVTQPTTGTPTLTAPQ